MFRCFLRAKLETALILVPIFFASTSHMFAQNENDQAINENHFLVGAAKTDITGPFVASSTGYNSPGDEMSGLAMRLHSRAFVIEQAGKGLVALVTAEQLHMYQSIKLGVMKELQQEGYGHLFNDQNVLLSATHTHAATSNTSWYTLYNLFNGVTGFDALHFKLVTSGIAQSIVEAYQSRKEATIRLASGSLEGASYNRSFLAYQANKDADQFEKNVDDRMWLLRFDSIDGSPIGLMNWYATHGTSLGIDNRRIHGDNKGWAAYRFEKSMGGEFVAAFAQGAMGDSSPNQPNPLDIKLPFLRPHDLDPELDIMEDPIVAGNIQYYGAEELYQKAENTLPVQIDFRHTYVDFNERSIGEAYTQHSALPWDGDLSLASTCIGAIGGGFLAGDEEGAPVDLAAEGEIKNTYSYENGEWVMNKYDYDDLEEGDLADALGLFWPLASATLQTEKYDACHKEKSVLLPVGEVDDFWFPNPEVPFIPVNVPIQLIRIGSVSILGTPFEMTTMTGRRIRKALSQTLAAGGIEDVILAGMANSYGQYLTTREEYAEQHFEGAFTLFGPWSIAAVIQEAERIAADMIQGKPSQTTTPPDLSNEQFIETWISSNGVVTDGGDFGEVLSDVEVQYASAKDTAVVSFRAAHPRTILVKKMDGSLDSYYEPSSYTFLEVQRLDEDQWITVADDGDPYTSFDWAREGGPDSLSDKSTATVTWLIRDQTPGTYRIKYNGLAKRNIFFGIIYEAFTGYSSEFQLN